MKCAIFDDFVDVAGKISSRTSYLPHKRACLTLLATATPPPGAIPRRAFTYVSRPPRGPKTLLLPGVKVGRLGLLRQLVLAVRKRRRAAARLRGLRGCGSERRFPRFLLLLLLLEGGGVRGGRGGRGDCREGADGGTEESPARSGMERQSFIHVSGIGRDDRSGVGNATRLGRIGNSARTCGGRRRSSPRGWRMPRREGRGGARSSRARGPRGSRGFARLPTSLSRDGRCLRGGARVLRAGFEGRDEGAREVGRLLAEAVLAVCACRRLRRAGVGFAGALVDGGAFVELHVCKSVGFISLIWRKRRSIDSKSTVGHGGDLEVFSCRPQPRAVHTPHASRSENRPQAWMDRTGTKVRVVPAWITVWPPAAPERTSPAPRPRRRRRRGRPRGTTAVSRHEGRASRSDAAGVPSPDRSLPERGSDTNSHLYRPSQSYSPRRGPPAA